MAKTAKRPVLILVHPGSACGSADFNLGRDMAAACRKTLVRDIDAWTGDFFVIDGELSEELDEEYDGLGVAIGNAQDRCKKAGFRVKREWGCDNIPPHQGDRIRAWISQGALDPETMRTTLTGAWYNPNGETGCITGVAAILESGGFSVDIRDSAICEQGELEDELAFPSP